MNKIEFGIDKNSHHEIGNRQSFLTVAHHETIIRLSRSIQLNRVACVLNGRCGCHSICFFLVDSFMQRSVFKIFCLWTINVKLEFL